MEKSNNSESFKCQILTIMMGFHIVFKHKNSDDSDFMAIDVLPHENIWKIHNYSGYP